MQYVLVRPTIGYTNLARLTKYKQPNKTMLLDQAKQVQATKHGNVGFARPCACPVPTVGLALWLPQQARLGCYTNQSHPRCLKGFNLNGRPKRYH